MLASRWKQSCHNARGPPKGDMYTMDESNPRSFCEEAVWGKYGEPRMSASERLWQLQNQEVEDEAYTREHHVLAQTMLVMGNEVGTSPAKVHGPKKVAPGSRVGEGYRQKGSFSELHIRTAAGSADECRHYIALGFPLDATDSGCDGWGVLHYAAKWDRTDVIELMLNYGADATQEDWNGVRPQDIAREKGNYAALRMLQKHITHQYNKTVPATSQLPAFKVKSNRTSALVANPNASSTPFAENTPKFAMRRAEELGFHIDQDGDGKLDAHELKEAGLKRGVVDQDGDGQVSQREQEDFDELTKDLKEWLIEMKLGYYFNQFTDAGLYTLDDLREADLTEDELEEDMGVASSRERTKVLQALARL